MAFIGFMEDLRHGILVEIVVVVNVSFSQQFEFATSLTSQGVTRIYMKSLIDQQQSMYGN